MFNDDVQMGFFDLYDQYLLNILYDPRIRPGMTRAEVEALLPEVLPAGPRLGRGNNKRRSARSASVPHGGSAISEPAPAMHDRGPARRERL